MVFQGPGKPCRTRSYINRAASSQYIHCPASSPPALQLHMEPRRTARRHKYETDTSLPAGLRSIKSGSWRVIYLDEKSQWFKSCFNFFTRFNIREMFKTGLDTIKQASIARYLEDVYFVAPGLVLGYLLVSAVASLQSALELQALNRLFHSVEAVVRGEGPSARQDVIRAIVIRLFIANAGALCSWLSTTMSTLLNERITSSFKARLIEAHLGLDVVSAQDKSNTFSNFSPSISSEAFHGLVRLVTSLMSSFSQVSVTAHLLRRQEGGMMIVFLSLLNPIFSWASTQILWDMLAVLYLSDSWALRARAMYNLATDPKYHEEVTSYGLHRYISTEYRWASQGSPLAYEDDPTMVLRPHRTPLRDMVKSTLADLPLVSLLVADDTHTL
ncbi:hypothetical protein BC629DRAFT_745680 [Irpex lacteus]|nr:hypothetical protein BC629DRAFT_745680 [Irpex lacteus]